MYPILIKLLDTNILHLSETLRFFTGGMFDELIKSPGCKTGVLLVCIVGRMYYTRSKRNHFDYQNKVLNRSF